MKTATVTAYLNTGYTGINVPDSPAIIENNYQSKQLSVINCLPLSGQVDVSIRVKSYDELHATDYIKMVFSGDNTTYWAKVNGYSYLSSDTVEMSLTMDYWLTMGGITNIKSISGNTNRVHVAKNDDVLFAYTEPDEMINPAKALKMDAFEFDISLVNDHHFSSDKIVCLSTLDLYAIGKTFDANDTSGLANAITLSDGNSGTVTIPQLWSVGDLPTDHSCWTSWGVTFPTNFSDGTAIPNPICGGLLSYVPDPQDESDYDNVSSRTLNLPNIGYFDASNSVVQKGIAAVHNCGVEDCLLELYVIPKEYLSHVNYGYANAGGRVYLESVDGNGLFTLDRLKYEYGSYTPRNKKVFTGDVNAYTLYAKANADMESFNPENLYLHDASPQTEPIFRMFADLRKQGGAMCMPLALNDSIKNWYLNYVKELEFQNAPIRFDGASGALVNQGMLKLQQNASRANYIQEFPFNGQTLQETMGREQTFWSTLGGAIGGVVSTAAGALGAPTLTEGIGNIIGNIAEGAFNKYGMDEYLGTMKQARANKFWTEKYAETASLGLKNTYVAPQIKFQASQTLRELVGNGFIITKYMMEDSDLERCDKLLTMYGYRHNKPLEITDLTNRPAFNYVECGDVHIETLTPVAKWIKEGCETQFVAMRVWHQVFDPSQYEDNE